MLKNSKVLIDTCIWIGYYKGDLNESKKIIEDDTITLFTSAITLYEIKVYLSMQKIPKTIINNILERIDETSIIIPAEKSVCILASENALKFNLHATDALIYTTSRDINSIFVTADKHFSKTPKTLLI